MPIFFSNQLNLDQIFVMDEKFLIGNFDPNADYIRTWVPELKDLSCTMIHTPWEYSIPLSYPAPIVNHAVQRTDALKRYATIKTLKDTI